MLLLIKFVLFVVGLAILALLFGGWVKFRGLAPIITVAIFIVPLNVFLPQIGNLIGVPPGRLIPFFIAGVVLNGVAIYALSFAINRFRIENFPAAIAFSVLLSAWSFAVNIHLAERILAML